MAIDVLPLLEQLGRDSLSREKACPLCDGIGSADGVTRRGCPMCRGVGSVRVAGDPLAIRMFSEIIGLTGPKRGRPTWWPERRH
jgi:hypothetical protein